jgi:hypothetical protein
MAAPLYKQGDVVWLNDPIPIPDGSQLAHPVIIISSNMSNSYENYYTGLMMSTTPHTDKFTFACSQDMFEGNLNKDHCQIRIYISVSFRETAVRSKMNKMKPIFFKALMENIKNYLFAID